MLGAQVRRLEAASCCSGQLHAQCVCASCTAPCCPAAQLPACSPQGWIGFVETCAPEIIPHVSTCKSPHMMVGSVLKTYFAEVGAGLVRGVDFGFGWDGACTGCQFACWGRPARVPAWPQVCCCQWGAEADSSALIWSGCWRWHWQATSRPPPSPAVLLSRCRRRLASARTTSAWSASCPACASRARRTA